MLITASDIADALAIANGPARQYASIEERSALLRVIEAAKAQVAIPFVDLDALDDAGDREHVLDASLALISDDYAAIFARAMPLADLPRGHVAFGWTCVAVFTIGILPLVWAVGRAALASGGI